MEQGSPENEGLSEGPRTAEDETSTSEFGAVPAIETFDEPSDSYGSQGPVRGDIPADKPVLTESPVDVVDPYTAAPPASPFADPAPPLGERGPFSSWTEQAPADDPSTPIPYSPASTVENIRRSGLAYSAGIAFFGSVAFSLFTGWIVDLLLGISPWGIILGIVLGSIVGFVQFFRITSRIFPKEEDGPEVRPLMSAEDDEGTDRF